MVLVLQVKLDVEPGGDILVVRSNMLNIQDVFAQINDRINEEMALHPSMQMMYRRKKDKYSLEVILGHVRYGTFGKIVSKCSSFLRQNNWMHRT
jgi:amidophosphoribosyltransferase